MIFSKKCRRKLKAKCFQYLRCGAKTITFLFWVSLYMLIMKLTLFKSNSNTTVVKDWPLEPDNYSKWLMRGPIHNDPETTPADNYMEMSEPDNETIALVKSRVARVQEVCQIHGLRSQSVKFKEFFVDHGHNFVWCNIFKAASSTWLYNFNILGGYKEKFLQHTGQWPLSLARKVFPRPSRQELMNAVNTPGVVTLLIVREPFVRLLSAYRDKLENRARPYYKNLAKSIIKEHRKEATKIFGPIRTLGPTFYEFVAYLIKMHKTKHPNWNEHWAPYYEFCSPCAVNFTVVGKVETLWRDSAYVIQQLGLGHILGWRMRRLPVINRSRDGLRTKVLLKNYFSQINKQMLKELLDIYGVDFEMFGYNPKVYSHYVRE